MKIKSNSLNIILAIVIFTVIASMLFGSTTIVQPYSEDTLFARQYAYEGFSDYGNVSGTGNADSMFNSNLMQSASASTGASASMDCTKVYGFDGLFCKPFVADNSIDRFSAVSGSKECVGKSSGLSNSKGGLCLDDNLATMLRTRGGNQTGSAMEIGK